LFGCNPLTIESACQLTCGQGPLLCLFDCSYTGWKSLFRGDPEAALQLPTSRDFLQLLPMTLSSVMPRPGMEMISCATSFYLTCETCSKVLCRARISEVSLLCTTSCNMPLVFQFFCFEISCAILPRHCKTCIFRPAFASCICHFRYCFVLFAIFTLCIDTMCTSQCKH
jgi:hypothetical protein